MSPGVLIPVTKSHGIILITGSRYWNKPLIIRRTLQELRMSEKPWLAIVHGDCKTGADQQCSHFCVELGIAEFRCPANWGIFGKAAGPIRNEWMLYVRPAHVLAFHESLRESTGTIDMLHKAKGADIPYHLHNGTRWGVPRL